MDSWFKAAEGFLEVVDRRAKLVVSELAEDQPDSQISASNGQGSQAKQTKSAARTKTTDIAPEQTDSITSQVAVTPEKDKDPNLIKNDETSSSNSMVQTTHGNQDDFNNSSPLLEIPHTDKSENDTNLIEVSVNNTDQEDVTSTSNVELLNESNLEVREEISLPMPAKQVQIVNTLDPVETDPRSKSGDTDFSQKIDQEKSQSTNNDVLNDGETLSRVADLKIEPRSNQKKQEDPKAIASPKKVQEQLDEAQGLLKTTISTGQSKEARLARVCAGLQNRLQEYKSENAQLEELLVAERELSKSFEARIKQLQQDLSESKIEVTRVESNMGEALAAKNSEIEALVGSMDALKKQTAVSEGNLASLQANMESIMRNRELTETRMMQALREELASVERRAEEERAAHNATKLAFMEREVELEHRALDASTALARIQRTADERTAKAAELEQKVALLEVECANLNQELQDMEARAWQEEVERARQGQRDAESKLSSLDAEVQKMRVEMAAMKRDAEHYSRQEHMELEKRYRELTDLLYYKQTQLETMASEKAAAEFQLEKELKRRHEAQAEAERSRVSRRPSSSWEEDTEIKTLETLPLHHRHMATASMQLQKAAKLLDSGAVRATRFLWRYPTARIILLFYLVFVHLFLMYLLHRLQEQADDLSARDVANAMGLANPTLP
ncbi:hypothetical protein G4B88_013600 [Cannabis sativa]|uniref:Golgin-84 n=1 Tax=Cannabis sativa TaxID=3483 RepID=A0A7J6HUH7_CANSA|nr:hypothetical protein G4B88_013600 [Cannabis sativa]